MTQSVTIDDNGNAVVTKKNDTITIDGNFESVTIPASKGSDSINFTAVDSIDKLTFTQAENSKDLIISYQDEQKKVIVKNYFTSTLGTATKSSVKTIQIGNETFKITDLYQYTNIAPAKKGAMTGTIFSDIVSSTEANEKFTLKTGNNVINVDITQPCGDDVINLTKGENLTININGNEGYNGGNYTTTVQGKDYVLTFYSESNLDESSRLGSLRLKNFAKVNGVGNNGSVIVNAGENTIDLTKEIIIKYGGIDVNMPTTMLNYDKLYNNGFLKTGKVNGTRLSENIDVSEYEGIGKKAGKGVTISAGAGNDIVKGSKYNDTIKAVSGTNTIIGNEGNDKLYAGKGADTFMFAEGDGNDIVYSSDIADKLIFEDSSKLEYEKSGNNLIIKYGENDSVTLSNYFKQKEGKALKIADDAVIKTSNGTYLNDYIEGNYKNNTIKAGKGNDVIIGGWGDDKLYGGEGSNEFRFNVGDGNDTVYAAKDAVNKLVFSEDYDSRTYTVKGNDVIITSIKEYQLKPYPGPILFDTSSTDDFDETTAQGSYTEINSKHYFAIWGTDTVTVKDYLKGGYNVTIDNEDLTDILKNENIKYGNEDARKGQTLKGSFLNETFTGSDKADKIYTGAGNDTINLGKGNDTIYLNGEGEKTLYFTKGEGNKTVYMNYDGVKANFVFDKPASEIAMFSNEITEDQEHEFSYEKKGNDIVVKYNDTDEKVTIKNYFANNAQDTDLKINGEGFNPPAIKVQTSSSKNNNIDMTQNGLDKYSWDISSGNKRNIITTGDGNDRISAHRGQNIINAGNGDNSIHFDENAYAHITAGTGDDKYYVRGLYKWSTINDLGGNDSLYIRTTEADGGDKLTYVFNVNKEGQIIDVQDDISVDQLSKKLVILNEKGVDAMLRGKDYDGGIDILNFFDDKENGKIEEIFVNGEKAKITDDAWVAQICESIASWLNDHEGYECTDDVNKSGNTEDMKSLLAVYQTGIYEQQVIA